MARWSEDGNDARRGNAREPRDVVNSATERTKKRHARDSVVADAVGSNAAETGWVAVTMVQRRRWVVVDPYEENARDSREAETETWLASGIGDERWRRQEECEWDIERSKRRRPKSRQLLF